MTYRLLEKLFEHNNWANEEIIRACLALSDEQLDAKPRSATQGSIRSTLLHLVASQHGYLRLLTLPVEERLAPVPAPPFAEVQKFAATSGESLLELISDGHAFPNARLQTRDGYYVEPWVVVVQIINHATEHREQIKSMLSALGVTPPNIDGWDYGEATNRLVPISQ